MSAPRDDALPDGDGPALVEAEEATSGADLYAVLGVTPAATDDEIRRAFRTQAKRWHPDRFTAGPPERPERAEPRIPAAIAAPPPVRWPPIYLPRRCQRAATSAARLCAARSTNAPPVAIPTAQASWPASSA